MSTEVVRVFDAARANAIVNDPDVFPSVAPKGLARIDMAPLVADPGNVLFEAAGGCILFAHDAEPGRYEVHTSFLDGYRGRHAIDCSLNAYRWMFTHTDCLSILTRIPAINRPARMAARSVGFEPRFTRANIWPTEVGAYDMGFYELPYHVWLDKDRDFLIDRGRWFHDRLAREFARHGVTEKHHADEDCHDLQVGACVETVFAGQVEKGVILYNRWARWSGYAQITLVARSPLVIDIGDAVLVIENNSFKVVTCRPAHS